MVADDPLELLRLLADDSRLRTFCAVVLGARRSSEVAEKAGLPMREAVKGLSSLETGGLVVRRGHGWVARPERLREALAASVEVGPADAADPSAAVLRVYLPGGRLAGLPARHDERLVVLDHIARLFEPGLRYAEVDVNARLAGVYADPAVLRRHLVDEGFLAREYGIYWRIGGTVVV